MGRLRARVVEECRLSMEFSRGLEAVTKYVPKDELVLALDALEGIASKGDQDIVSALETATTLLTKDPKDKNISYAVVDKKILPELVAILKEPRGQSAYRAALDVLGSIIASDQGRHVEAVVDAGACPVLLRIIQPPLGPLLTKSLLILSFITDKVGTRGVFPGNYSLKHLINVADNKSNLLCLDLIKKLLQERIPSKADAEHCVRFLYKIFSDVNRHPQSMEKYRACVGVLHELHKKNPDFLDESVADQLNTVHDRLIE